jgi:hypothetical protein
MIVVAPTFVLAFIDVRVVVIGFAPFPKEMGEQQATAATATKQAARDQETHGAAIIGTRVLVLAFIDVGAVVVGFAPFPKEMGEQQATAATAAEHAAGDEEAHDAVIVVAGLTVFALFDLVARAGIMPFIQKLREQETPHAFAAKQPAGGEEAGDIAVPSFAGAIYGCA